MTGFHVPTQNRRRVGLVALVLVVALVLPSLAWADHSSDHPYSQYDDPALISAEEHFAALVDKYESGELEYHAPGRRDDTSFGSSASDAFSADSARMAALGATFASQTDNADSARMAALGATFASPTGNADSARWAALGATFASQTGNADSARWAALGATFASQTDNPELSQFWRFAGQDGCSVTEVQC